MLDKKKKKKAIHYSWPGSYPSHAAPLMLSLSSGHLLFSLPVHAQVQESQLFKRREAVLTGFLPQPGLFLSSPLLSLGQVSICGLNTPIHAGSTFPTSSPLWPVIWEVLVMIWLQSIYALYVPAVSTI